MKLIKNFQINVSFNDDSVENFSITTSKVHITKTDTSTPSTRAVVFKFSILKIAFVISRKTSQAEKIDQLNKSNIVSSTVNSVSFQVQFLNLDKKIFVSFISQDSRFAEHEF